MKKLKIVIIDNDEDEQFFIRKGFQATGLFEISAMLQNGNELGSGLKRLPFLPHVIISDLNMPGKSGYEILDDLKSDPALSSIPVIITTNLATPAIEDECKKRGAFQLKSKPDNFLQYEQFAQELYRDIVGAL